MASRKPREPGWYPDASDPVAERYWDGTQWHGRRMYYLFNKPPAELPPVSTGLSTVVWLMVIVGSVVLVIVLVCLLARHAMGL